MSWLPTLKAMRSPKGQQIMIPTPGQPKAHHGIGAVNYHTGETMVLVRRHKRRKEIAELLQALGCRAVSAPLPTNLQPLAQPGGDALAALSPGSNTLRVVPKHHGGRRRNAGFLPALQCPTSQGALNHRLQSRMICVAVLKGN